MADFKHMVKCFCCGSEFQFGLHAYLGRKVNGYEFMACRNCYDGNWDGWVPHLEPKILAHLHALGIDPPPRNSSGWLPRDWPSPSA